MPIYSAAVHGVSDFYAVRSGRPLWYTQQGRQVALLLDLLRSAEADGLDPGKYRVDELEKAVGERVPPTASERLTAQIRCSVGRSPITFATFARRSSRHHVVDPELKMAAPSPLTILDHASKAPSLEQYVAEMQWMNPLYVQLRQAPDQRFLHAGAANLIRVNMERVRALPSGTGRYILVNAAQQRLFMMDNREAVDSMRVVVGKPIYPTPMMAAYVRFANLNPYWYVPADLAAERIAPNVVKLGLPYLQRQGYQVVSDFVKDPQIIDPTTIDWKAVADGRQRVLIRQLPGAYNSMGRIKFMFPNEAGVYLHDNPERELFEQAARLYSGGCVRLEAAWRLSRWLFDKDLTWEGAGPEQEVPLAKPVPVYITYLTAVPDGSQVASSTTSTGAIRRSLLKGPAEQQQPPAKARLKRPVCDVVEPVWDRTAIGVHCRSKPKAAIDKGA